MMNAPFPMPQADQSAILNALAALFQPDDVIELRSFAKGRKRTDAGYFDGEHRRRAGRARDAAEQDGAAVYVTLNPIDPQLLSRYANRIETRRGGDDDGRASNPAALAAARFRPDETDRHQRDRCATGKRQGGSAGVLAGIAG
jgi:hypothetical protein